MFITLVMILHFFFNHLTGLVKINNDINKCNNKENSPLIINIKIQNYEVPN